jgi:hypothetical protein
MSVHAAKRIASDGSTWPTATTGDGTGALLLVEPADRALQIAAFELPGASTSPP